MGECSQSSQAAAWPAILTWRAHDVPRMESVRVQLSGKRIKAYGRIVAAATDTNPAFSASYDLRDRRNRRHQAALADGHAGRAGTAAVDRPRRREHVAGHRPPGRVRAPPTKARSTSTWSSARSSTRCRSGGPACTSGPIRSSLPVVYVKLPDLSVDPGDDQLQQRGRRRHQAALAGRRTPRSPSTPTGSSSTTQDWQSGSDHPAGTAGGGQFVAPILGADDDRDDLRPAGSCRSGSAAACPALDQLGHRSVVCQRRRGPALSNSMARSSARQQLARSSPRTWPAPDPARWPRPGCRPGTSLRPARTPAAPRRP